MIGNIDSPVNQRLIMKKLLPLLLLSFSFLYAQMNVSGNLSSSLYSFETKGEKSNLDFYQGINFKITPQSNPNIYFQNNLVFIKRNNPSDWSNKLYSSYVGWNIPQEKLHFRLGRQFLYSGVITGTMDALVVSASPVKQMGIKLVSGLVTPFDRAFELTKWKDGNILGGYASYKFNNKIKTDVSYVQKTRDDEIYWQQAGAVVSGNFSEFFYYLKYDHNLLTSEYQTYKANVSYYITDWYISAEYSSQKPRIYEDSFFSLFKINKHDQIRFALTRSVNEYKLGFQFINTTYPESENTQQVLTTLSNNWGIVGLVYQMGYGGDNLGIYAEIEYKLLSNLKFNLYSSHYKYERQSVKIEEQATAFSTGVQYLPYDFLRLDLQIQESINSFYKSDLRGLFRLNYSFNY
jgi:hypothetical protein